jgi:hypothetical protein
MVIVGDEDIFFPASNVIKKANDDIPNLVSKTYEMEHIPSEQYLNEINKEMIKFLSTHY